jgi:hypothetical protein
MTRNCCCPVARHVHGTEQAYISDYCRCLPCKAAHASRAAYRRRMYAYGRDIAHLVPAAGTARRLEALALNGWSAPMLAALLGTNPTVLQRCRTQQRITAAKAARIADLYEQLWDVPAPTDTPGRRIAVPRTVREAQRRGYRPAMAWDDESIDDPAVECAA